MIPGTASGTYRSPAVRAERLGSSSRAGAAVTERLAIRGGWCPPETARKLGPHCVRLGSVACGQEILLGEPTYDACVRTTTAAEARARKESPADVPAPNDRQARRRHRGTRPTGRAGRQAPRAVPHETASQGHALGDVDRPPPAPRPHGRGHRLLDLGRVPRPLPDQAVEPGRGQADPSGVRLRPPDGTGRSVGLA